MEFYSDDKGIELGIFKLDDKGKTYIEVSHYKDADKERIYQMMSEITPKTPEKVIEEMFKDFDCHVRTKSFFVKKKKFNKRMDIAIYTGCILLALLIYLFN